MINFENFVEWAENRLGDIIIKGHEIRANSIFHPTGSDTKHRLWMNPSGEIKKGDRADGVYHCFDTNRKGTLIGLVMHVDKCSYSEALDRVGSRGNLANLEKQVEEFFKYKTYSFEETKSVKLTLPEFTVDLTFDCIDLNMIKAAEFLEKRKIPLKGMLYCVAGNYANRIVIPYYDKDKNLIYYNTRAMNNWSSKYLGPPKEIGVGKEDVIFINEWKNEDKIYLTEGEFDAISLNLSGFYSGALGGKNISTKQIEYIKNNKICLALDNDIAGKKALLTIWNKLKDHGITEISYVNPPNRVKDWNEFLINSDEEVLKAYIEQKEKAFNDSDVVNMSFDFILK